MRLVVQRRTDSLWNDQPCKSDRLSGSVRPVGSVSGFCNGGAIVVTFFGYRLILKRDQPHFAHGFSIPSRTDIDAPLLFGPILFGVGWGLVGLCPGPAIAALAASPKSTWVFFVSMLAGMVLMQSYRSNNSANTTGATEAANM